MGTKDSFYLNCCAELSHRPACYKTPLVQLNHPSQFETEAFRHEAVCLFFSPYRPFSRGNSYVFRIRMLKCLYNSVLNGGCSNKRSGNSYGYDVSISIQKTLIVWLKWQQHKQQLKWNFVFHLKANLKSLLNVRNWHHFLEDFLLHFPSRGMF